MGYMGPGLPGQRSVLVDADREFVERLWDLPQGTLRTDVGTGTVDMFARMAAGEIKACWIICTNPVATVANRKTVLAGLEAAELVVTQDVFVDTETNAYADITLPATLWVEGEGVMINSERNLTLVRKALPAPGEAIPDWQIIARIACAMGYSDAFGYTHAEEILDEIKRAWNPKTGYDLRGVSYQRLREGPLQWPIAPDGPARNPIRYHNDGISQEVRAHPDGSTPRLWFPTASTSHSPATCAPRSTSRTGCANTAPTSGDGSTTGRISTSAATPPAWPRTSTPRCARSSRTTAT